MASIRCFVGLELSAEVRTVVTNEMGRWNNKGFLKGQWETADDLHVTLRFMGNLDAAQLDTLKEKLANVDFQKFTLTAGPTKYFSGPKHAPIRTLYAKADGINDLQQKIDEAIMPNFPMDKRHSKMAKEGNYNHHITFCRVKKILTPSDQCFQFVAESNFSMQQVVDSFVIMECTGAGRGAKYKPIARFPSTL